MAEKLDALALVLYAFATKNESVFIIFKEFADYLHKYAQKNLDTDVTFSAFVSIEEDKLLSELEALETQNVVRLINKAGNVRPDSKIIIAVLDYYNVQFNSRYESILRNRKEPFPCVNDLPKQIPSSSFQRRDAKEFILETLKNQDTTSHKVVCLSFPNNLTPLLYPLSCPIATLIKGAVFKIADLINRDEYHEYFLKKLKMTNPNKEITTRNFYEKLSVIGDSIEDIFTDDEESFYNWGQLCYFIKDDFEKIQERSGDDVSMLQSLFIGSVWSLHIKETRIAQKKQDEAKRYIEGSFKKPPYFFTMEDVLKFCDDNGNVLFKTLGKEGLQEALDELTGESDNNMLPRVLTVTIDSGRRYYVHKSNVMPLIIRLSNEAHNKIQAYLVDAWYKVLLKGKKLPEFKEQAAFEKTLEKCVRHFSPLLYALLNSSFLPVLNVEQERADIENKNIRFNIYIGSKLQPYSEMLMLQNDVILSKAKELLPFWYTIPIINVIFKFFFLGNGDNVKDTRESKETKTNAESRATGGVAKKLSDAAADVSKEIIPEGSDIDRELDSYVDQWNKIITKDIRANLTNDVNSLIRDYLHSVKSRLKTGSFTLERVQGLAHTLCNTPNFKRINGGDALYMYTQLYMLKLLMRG